MAGEPGALWGTFSEPGSLAVGGPFTKPTGEGWGWGWDWCDGRDRRGAICWGSVKPDPAPPPRATAATKLPRHGGKQFATAPPRAGRAPDAYLDRAVRSLGEGAPYEDAWLRDRRLARAGGKPISSKPFVTRAGRAGSVRCVWRAAG
jgi:hypothetical protein